MIFYFSATGNNEHIARTLALATEDTLYHMATCLRDKHFSFEVAAHESIGIIAPTYFMGLPLLVIEFLEALDLRIQDKQPYLYHVATYGNFSGKSHGMLKDLMAAKGFELHACFGVRTVDTWTPLFDLSNSEKNHRAEARADAQTQAIVRRVQVQAKGNFDKRCGPPIVSPFMRTQWLRNRSTSAFSIDDTCIGCGICMQNCPVNAITLENEKPVWTVPQCEECLSCLHHCPVFAIQRGPHTRKHGQYVHPRSSQ